jgi:hypothetical protein
VEVRSAEFGDPFKVCDVTNYEGIIMLWQTARASAVVRIVESQGVVHEYIVRCW